MVPDVPHTSHAEKIKKVSEDGEHNFEGGKTVDWLRILIEATFD